MSTEIGMQEKAKRGNKNKLPRKRKKAFIKDIGRGNYIAFQVINEIELEEKKFSDFRFPKYKFIEGKGNVVIGFW